MRRFILVFNVTQAELDARHFMHLKLNIVSTLRRARCVLLVVRETKQVLCVDELIYQTASGNLKRVDFTAPRDVTAHVIQFDDLTRCMHTNVQDLSIRHFGRSVDMDGSQAKRFYTQLEIVA